jgi:hypothetical protein
MDSPLEYFAELRDPRVERTREHLLEEILLMAIVAVLSGTGSWNEIEDYGNAKRPRFKGLLQLPGGIPSHDTYNRVISALDPAEMEKGFSDWMVSIAKLSPVSIADVGRLRRASIKEFRTWQFQIFWQASIRILPGCSRRVHCWAAVLLRRQRKLLAGPKR